MEESTDRTEITVGGKKYKAKDYLESPPSGPSAGELPAVRDAASKLDMGAYAGKSDSELRHSGGW